MTEVQAISEARGFLEGRNHAQVHWDKVKAVRFTTESIRSTLAKENFGGKDAETKAFILKRAQRSCWEVSFPLVIPDGVVWSPDSICVKVYEDTAECEIVWQL